MTWLTPDWPAPSWVKALSTTRTGGVSGAPYTSFNLACHVEDSLSSVIENRSLLMKKAKMPNSPIWLNQVHGTHVVSLPLSDALSKVPIDADASYTRYAKNVCAVMSADCLPVLFCDKNGTQVAAAHAGWRGLLDGVLEKTVAHFFEPKDVMAWLGPAIGPLAFEVGDDVRQRFLAKDPSLHEAFRMHDSRWLADLYKLAKRRLARVGVTHIYGGHWCTASNPQHFFSYRRDKITGRQASCIWIDSDNQNQNT